jgi:hypothetical protein
VDEVAGLTGIPFAVIRGERELAYLRLLIQKPSSGELDPIGTQLRARVQEKLQIEVRVDWTEELPERWKGVTVIEEKDLGAPRV